MGEIRLEPAHTDPTEQNGWLPYARDGTRQRRRRALLRRRPAIIAAAVVATAALVVVLSGCGGNGQSTVNPNSTASSQIADLWWAMLGAAVVVFGGTTVYLGIGWYRRHKEGLPVFGQSERVSTGLVVFFGVAVPVVVLAAVFTAANLFVIKQTQAPAASTTRMTIHVIGHQWWWEVRYPGTPAVTANEIHLPARTRVNLIATTADVIHSFWVPELNRKIDMIPGRENRILLYADKPGVFRGQCAEFCGLQHAHMAMRVFAQPPAQFRAWLANMEKPIVKPATAMGRAGEQVFLTQQCASCHTLRGTGAQGRIGPDLTHLMTRTTLAALTIPNDRGHLAGWVLDPQHIKPGNDMPGLDLGSRDFQALLAFLETLR